MQHRIVAVRLELDLLRQGLLELLAHALRIDAQAHAATRSSTRTSGGDKQRNIPRRRRPLINHVGRLDGSFEVGVLFDRGARAVGIRRRESDKIARRGA